MILAALFFGIALRERNLRHARRASAQCMT
jgi:hypothetical protein